MPATHPSTQIADVLSPQGKSALHATLAEHGIARFAGIPDAHALVELARSVGTVVSHRDSDSRGVTTIAARLGGAPRGRRAFTRQALAPHTDSSGIATPPHLVFVSCAQAAHTSGECVTVDARAIYSDLAHEHPNALADLCTPRTVLFGGAAGHLGAVFTRFADDRLAVRLRLDDLATFSPLVTRHLPILRTMIERHSVTMMLRPGQGYVLDNYRWLHGRGAFTGDRVFYRVHSNPSTASELPRGFTPIHASIHAAV
jgi:alpha-ketoglutarate-dependent taurine dioxygenase